MNDDLDEDDFDGEEERCPYCNSVHVVGSMEECEHYVGVHHEGKLIWYIGGEISELWESIVDSIAQFFEETHDDGILSILPDEIRGKISDPEDLGGVSPVKLIGWYSKCKDGRDVQIDGIFDKCRTALYCENPRTIYELLLALRAIKNLISNFDSPDLLSPT